MEGKRLANFVTVTHPETREAHWFGPGDKLPDWAERLITNPSAWEDIPTEGDAATSEEPEVNDAIGQMSREELITALANAGAVAGEDFPVSAGKSRLAQILRERVGSQTSS